VQSGPLAVCDVRCALSAKSRMTDFCTKLRTNVTLFLTRDVQHTACSVRFAAYSLQCAARSEQ